MKNMQWQNRKNFPDRSGFSMVEIMMVVLLIGILAGVTAPPMFKYLASSRLQTASDQMIGDLTYARTMAISNGSILRFSSTLTGYQLANPVTGNILRTRNFDNGMELTNVQTADFFPWGMADATNYTLSSGSESRQIRILPTGMVEVP